ncbi:MAG: DUF6338 family protein [Leptospiraceae bacterium]
MSVTGFLIRIIFLLLPGIIASSLFRLMRGRNPRKDWEDYLEIIVFAVFSYGLYGIFIWLLSLVFSGIPDFVFFDVLLDEEQKLNPAEVFGAAATGVIISFIATYIHTHKWINRVGHALHLTNHFGDADVWTHFHNIPDPAFDWIIVRDHRIGLVYFGSVAIFSDSGQDRELLMRDVRVYSNETGKLLYSVPHLYISRQPNELSMEIPVASPASSVHSEA